MRRNRLSFCLEYVPTPANISPSPPSTTLSPYGGESVVDEMKRQPVESLCWTAVYSIQGSHVCRIVIYLLRLYIASFRALGISIIVMCNYTGFYDRSLKSSYSYDFRSHKTWNIPILSKDYYETPIDM